MSRRLSLAVMLPAPWFFARAAFSPVHAARSRRQALLRRGYLAAYALTVLAVALAAPLLLVPIALAAAGATLVGLWYTRAAHGVRNGLPPGRLELAPVAPVTDHEFYARQAERLGPVFKTVSPVLPSPTVCVVGLPRGLALLRTHESRLGPIGISFDPFIPRRLVRHMTGEDHRHYRRLFQDAFRDDVVDACVPEIELIVAGGLRRLAEAAAERPQGISPRPYLEEIVLESFVRLFLGPAPGSPEAASARALLTTIGIEVGGPPGGERFREVERAASSLTELVRSQGAEIATLLAEGREPPPSFLAALLRDRPDALDDPTVTANLVFLLRTGSTDVTGLLHWVVKLLGDHPEWIGAVRDAADPDRLSRHVVMETLRLEQSELIFRTVREEIDVEGFTVPAGWHLRICVRESHQDPAVFPDPKAFDPERFERRYNRSEYSPLGALGHTCLGVHTVHAVGAAFVRCLADAYELEVRSDGPLEFRIHWRPGPAHRVALRRLAPVEEASDVLNSVAPIG